MGFVVTRMQTLFRVVINIIFLSAVAVCQPVSGNELQQFMKKDCIDIDVGAGDLPPFQRAEAVYAICAELAQTAQAEYSRELFIDKKRALNGYRAYENFKIEQRQHAFNLQYFFSIFSFVTAIGFLFFGFYLAHQQFLRDAKDQNKSVSTIKISKDGVEISSSVMGLMVLFLSLLFFYLFLKEVYSITEIEPTNTGKNTTVQQVDLPKD